MTSCDDTCSAQTGHSYPLDLAAASSLLDLALMCPRLWVIQPKQALTLHHTPEGVANIRTGWWYWVQHLNPGLQRGVLRFQPSKSRGLRHTQRRLRRAGKDSDAIKIGKPPEDGQASSARTQVCIFGCFCTFYSLC